MQVGVTDHGHWSGLDSWQRASRQRVRGLPLTLFDQPEEELPQHNVVKLGRCGRVADTKRPEILRCLRNGDGAGIVDRCEAGQDRQAGVHTAGGEPAVLQVQAVLGAEPGNSCGCFGEAVLAGQCLAP